MGGRGEGTWTEASEEECAFLSVFLFPPTKEGLPGELYFMRGTTFVSYSPPSSPSPPPIRSLSSSKTHYSLLVSSSLPCFLFLFSCFFPLFLLLPHTQHGETSELQPTGGNVPSANSEVVLRLGGVSAQCASFGGNGGKGTVPGKTDVKGKCGL